ncbi:MAG: hypothetical protein SPH90_05735 [Candidatus Alectryocaccobium sp.]|nr:hypothetical protein [Candidatus Alectryocaccobium sp.]
MNNFGNYILGITVIGKRFSGVKGTIIIAVVIDMRKNAKKN